MEIDLGFLKLSGWVEATSPGLPPATIRIPVSADPRHAPLAVAGQPAPQLQIAPGPQPATVVV